MTKKIYLIICIISLIGCRNLQELCYDHCDCETITTQSKCDEYICCSWVFHKYYNEAGIDKGTAGCECNDRMLEPVSRKQFTIDTSKISIFPIDIDENNTLFVVKSKNPCDNNFESGIFLSNNSSLVMFGHEKQEKNNVFVKECDNCNLMQYDDGDYLFKDLSFEEIDFKNTYLSLTRIGPSVYFESSELRGLIHFWFEGDMLEVNLSYLYDAREHDSYSIPKPLLTKCNITVSLPHELSIDGTAPDFNLLASGDNGIFIESSSINPSARFSREFETGKFWNILSSDDIVGCSDYNCFLSEDSFYIGYFRSNRYIGVISNFKRNAEDGTVSFDIKYSERW
jgi:hypothetical protein